MSAAPVVAAFLMVGTIRLKKRFYVLYAKQGLTMSKSFESKG